MPPKQSVKLVDGLDLLDPKSLPGTFRRFENDNLYFISACQYNRGETSAMYAPRCVALTPTAFFVTDTSGNMDRATRFEYIAGVVYQTRIVSKLIGKQEEYHYIIKSSKEPDIHFFFLKDHDWKKKDFTMSKDFGTTLLKILDDKRPGHGITVQTISSEQDLSSQLSAKKPQGYMSPKDIMLLNKQRKEIVGHVSEINKELQALKKEIFELKPTVIEKREELKELEGATSDEDLGGLRDEIKKLQSKINKLTASTTEKGMEISNLKRESTRLQDQLSEEQKNYQDLVNNRVSKADEGVTKEQNDMMLLRQKAQRRELDKMHAALAIVLEKLNSTKPTYSGHEGFAGKATDLESRVDAALIAWTKEMDASNKMEKFLDHISTDVEKINRHLQEQYHKKMKLIEDIEGKQEEELIMDDSPTLAPKSAPSFGSLSPKSKDDDGINLSGDISPTKEEGGVGGAHSMGIDLDDDLLGGGDAPTPSAAPTPAAATEGINLDDDI